MAPPAAEGLFVVEGFLLHQNSEQTKITPKQQAFIDAYVGEARYDATQAAIIAGYSPKSARQQGSNLYNSVHIRAEIDRRLREATLSADETLREITRIAMEQGDLKALELIGKAHSLFTEKQQVDMNAGIDLRIIGIADEDMP